ncbi:MAG: nucleotidyltransferase domain-containing protein [Candidatus Bathyarchaeia archaeon]
MSSALAIPTKIDKRLVEELDRLVQRGLYASRSEAIRDAVRRLVTERYLSIQDFHRILAEAASEAIVQRFGDRVTDVILFGSAAIGRSSPESDVDLLVLTGEGGLPTVDRGVIDAVYTISLASNVVITPIVMAREEFSELLEGGYVFAKEVIRNGIQMRGRFLYEVGGRGTHREG